ncbi:MAG: hypothetical protein VX641_01540 [Planctomycetota bacterium]|nr:hypothetical protein [Planctomycetota bacterium]
MTPTCLLTLVLSMFGLAQAAPSLDQDSPADGLESGQVLASQKQKVEFFGFEEASDFHSPLPKPFFRILSSNGRPGFPDFGDVQVVDSAAATGTWSLKFTLDGAPIGVGISRARLPIFPQSLYEIRSRVRTSGLDQARAVLKVRLLDRNGHEIPGTARSSEGVQTRGAWTTLSVQPPIEIEDAVDLIFELHVEQGSRPDLSGEVWFDDIEVWQLPRMVLESVPSTGITRYPESPVLRAEIRDLTTGGLSAVMRTRDLDGMVVDERFIEIRRGSTVVTEALEGLPIGWYQCDLELLDGRSVVASLSQNLCLLPPAPSTREGYRVPFFGFAMPSDQLFDINNDGRMIEALMPDYAVVPVWQVDQPGRLDAERSYFFNTIVDILHARQVETVFELAAIPRELLGDGIPLDPDQVCSLLSSAEEASLHLLPWMAEFGDEVSRWRIRNEVQIDSPEVRGTVENARVIASEFVAAPLIELHPATGGPSTGSVTEQPDGVMIVESLGSSVRTGVRPSSGAITADAVRIVHVRSDRSRPSPRARAESACRELVERWAQGVSRIESPAPWNPAADLEARGMNPEGFAFQIVAAHLSGNPPLVEVPLGRGVKAILASDEDDPVLVAWGLDGPGLMEIDESVGDLSVMRVDGSRDLIPYRSGSRMVEIGEAPVFIRGFDPQVTLFRAGISLEPAVIEAAMGLHDCTFKVSNPWPEAIDVRLRPVGPGTFQFQPRSRMVTIPPNQALEVPFSFSYPRLQVAGPVDLRIEAQVEGMQPFQTTLLVPTAIESDRMDLKATWRIAQAQDGSDNGLLVTVEITNTGSTPVFLKAFSQARGYAPMRRALPRIQPGESASRTFAYPGGHLTLGNTPISVGAYEIQGDARVVRQIEIPSELGAMVGADPSSTIE